MVLIERPVGEGDVVRAQAVSFGRADRGEREILGRLQARADQIAAEITDVVLAEAAVPGPARDATAEAEVRVLARRHLDGFLFATRAGTGPAPELLAGIRDRAVLRARQEVPLAAQLQVLHVAQRQLLTAIRREVGGDAGLRGAALSLTAKTLDYSNSMITTMADAYVETAQGELAELDAARRALIDALLVGGGTHGGRPHRGAALTESELARHAASLGFDAEVPYLVALVAVDDPAEREPYPMPPRWAIPAIAKAAGRTQRAAFVVACEAELVVLLDFTGQDEHREVLGRAGIDIRQAHGVTLRAGLGGPFTGVSGFADAYRQARRALRHTSADRPILSGPGDLLLFDELTAARDDTAELIPAATRAALSDPALRAALDAFVAADLSVAIAAKALFLHPNSLRYRLGRITKCTGRDPHRVGDLLELIAACRVLDAGNGRRADRGPRPSRLARRIMSGSDRRIAAWPPPPTSCTACSATSSSAASRRRSSRTSSPVTTPLS